MSTITKRRFARAEAVAVAREVVAAVGSEREVFEFVGLDYLRPRERHTLAR